MSSLSPGAYHQYMTNLRIGMSDDDAWENAVEQQMEEDMDRDREDWEALKVLSQYALDAAKGGSQ